jgi:hypothetical protein
VSLSGGGWTCARSTQSDGVPNLKEQRLVLISPVPTRIPNIFVKFPPKICLPSEAPMASIAKEVVIPEPTTAGTVRGRR